MFPTHGLFLHVFRYNTFYSCDCAYSRPPVDEYVKRQVTHHCEISSLERRGGEGPWRVSRAERAPLSTAEVQFLASGGSATKCTATDWRTKQNLRGEQGSALNSEYTAAIPDRPFRGTSNQTGARSSVASASRRTTGEGPTCREKACRVLPP